MKQNLKINKSSDLEKIAKSMAEDVRKRNWDLKDLIHYFEKDNDFDYKVRAKIWDEMEVNEMFKNTRNILKLLRAIVAGNEASLLKKNTKLRLLKAIAASYKSAKKDERVSADDSLTEDERAALNEIVDSGMQEEEDSYNEFVEEGGNPQNHIYSSLLTVKRYLERTNKVNTNR